MPHGCAVGVREKRRQSQAGLSPDIDTVLVIMPESSNLQGEKNKKTVKSLGRDLEIYVLLKNKSIGTRKRLKFNYIKRIDAKKKTRYLGHASVLVGCCTPASLSCGDFILDIAESARA